MTSFVEKVLAVSDRLSAHHIEHAFGGAIALGYHVESPRATADIDLNICLQVAQARSVLEALPESVSWSEADVAQIERSGQVRVFWAQTPLDLFFPQHELHAVVAARTEQVPFAGATISVLSATDLTVFKALFDRPKDWVDIAEMLAYGEVDVAEVRGWLVALLGEDDPRMARLDRPY